MMERLINNNFRFATLEMQNRQRVEFADLLLDIYPDLKTNHEQIKNNTPAKCLEKSHFFWHHKEAERTDDRLNNKEEAKRAVKLALFLVQQGYKADKITILAMYPGQTALIRQKMRKYEMKYGHLVYKEGIGQHVDQIGKGGGEDDFVIVAEDVEGVRQLMDRGLDGKNNAAAKKSIKINTVDMYHGDENDFVIVSLVRSNINKQIGFVGDINRRCVAQSRARCGLYFIGDVKMFSETATWKPMIEKMNLKGCVGDALALVCEHHPNASVGVKSSKNFTLQNFCKKDCRKKMSCGIHECNRKCQPPHVHECNEMVPFTHLTCGHNDLRHCQQDKREKNCEIQVKFQFQACQHPGEKKCFEDVNTMNCLTKVHVTLRCGHAIQKNCFENADHIKCQEKCAFLRACGHVCVDHRCFEHATKNICQDCERIKEAEIKKKREEEEKQRQANKQKVEQQIKKIEMTNVECVELLRQGETLRDYVDVEDQLKKYVQSGHNWYPQVKKIEEVKNPDLKIRFVKMSAELFDREPQAVKRFYRTSNEDVDKLVKAKFRLPMNPGKYGAGIYLVTESSKNDQETYSKGPNKLILCDVLLGNSMVVDKAMPDMNANELKKVGYDSLYAPRDTKGTGGALYDEYVVFNLDQVFPRYIISFTVKKIQLPVMANTVPFGAVYATGKKTIRSKRGTDINDPLESHFAFVESRFLRMLNRSGHRTGKHEITHIEFYMNPQLEANFNTKKLKLEQKYGKTAEYGFHGTKSDNIVDNIMNNNFIASRSGKFGAGVYFSEQPSYTFGYGGQNHLIMARILPGKTLECRNSGKL